jgi:hypothetical protein
VTLEVFPLLAGKASDHPGFRQVSAAKRPALASLQPTRTSAQPYVRRGTFARLLSS